MISLCKENSVLITGLRYFIVVLIILLINFVSVFESDAQEIDLNLRWQANGEPDLAGYRIYWRAGSSGDQKEDYDGIHSQNSQYNSPIELDLADLADVDNPTYLIPGMDESEVYFVRLTAYDNENPSLESELSEEYVTMRIESITTTSSDGDYGVGDRIEIQINFSEPATLENGNMLIVFNSGSAIVISPFDQLSSIDADYIVSVGDVALDLDVDSIVLDPTASLISVARSIHFPISIPSPNIASDHAILVDGVPPTSTIVSIELNGIGGYDVAWSANDDETGCDEIALLYKVEGESVFTVYGTVPLGGQKSIDGRISVDVQPGSFEAGTPYVLATRAVDMVGNIETDITGDGDIRYTFSEIVTPADSGDGGGGGGGGTCFVNLLRPL